MNCLLFSGAQSVGKSETIFRLANNLVTRGFILVAGTIPETFEDFRCILEGTNKESKRIRIIINSPSDTPQIIQDFKEFFDINGGDYDILISSVRDDDFYPRTEFFSIMNIISTYNFILEIPLAKITRRGDNFQTALNWYQSQIDNLVQHTLNNQPYIL